MEGEAYRFALQAHGDQLYQGRPYVESHVRAVVTVLRDFGFFGSYEAAGWLHDVVEDTDVGINEITKRFGGTVASMVYCCTGVGQNRKERSACIYQRIACYPRSAVVKLADRIANVEASAPGSSHLRMYRKEAKAFQRAISNAYTPLPMWERLNRAYRFAPDTP